MTKRCYIKDVIKFDIKFIQQVQVLKPRLELERPPTSRLLLCSLSPSVLRSSNEGRSKNSQAMSPMESVLEQDAQTH